MAPGSIWDHAADKDLLLTIIDGGGPGAAKWELVSTTMQGKGYTFTKEACRQHFQKIRKEAKTGVSVGSGNSSPTNPTPTPRKPKSKPTPTPRKGKSTTDSFSTTNGSFSQSYGNGNSYDEDDDEELLTPTPSKKRKVLKKEEGPAQSAPLFKIEGEGFKGRPIDLENDDLYHGVYQERY